MRALFLIVSVFVWAGTAWGVEAMEPKLAPEGIPVCGGILGFVCGPKDWCDYPEGGACGMSDQYGTCRMRPEFCFKIYMPVCGCNGKTYDNSCEAQADGWDVAYVGACRSEAQPN